MTIHYVHVSVNGPFPYHYTRHFGEPHEFGLRPSCACGMIRHSQSEWYLQDSGRTISSRTRRSVKTNAAICRTEHLAHSGELPDVIARSSNNEAETSDSEDGTTLRLKNEVGLTGEELELIAGTQMHARQCVMCSGAHGRCDSEDARQLAQHRVGAACFDWL